MTRDKAGNTIYFAKGCDTPFYTKSAAEHFEWLNSMVKPKATFRVLLPTRMWIECISKAEAMAIQAESGGQIMEFAR